MSKKKEAMDEGDRPKSAAEDSPSGSKPLRPKVTNAKAPRVVAVLDDHGPEDDEPQPTAKAAARSAPDFTALGGASSAAASSASRPAASRTTKSRRTKKSETELLIICGSVAVGGMFILGGILAAISGSGSTSPSDSAEQYAEEYEYYEPASGQLVEDGSPPPMSAGMKERLKSRQRWNESGGDFPAEDHADARNAQTSANTPKDSDEPSDKQDENAKTDNPADEAADTSDPDRKHAQEVP